MCQVLAATCRYMHKTRDAGGSTSVFACSKTHACATRTESCSTYNVHLC